MFTTTATDLHQLMNCPGSPDMPKMEIDNIDTAARDEGNAAHWLAQQIFAGGEPDGFIGQKAFNGFTITDDIAEYTCKYVLALDCGEMECLTTFSTDRWTVTARADHIKFRPELNRLTIDDFKTGYRIVEPENNWTLIAHAIGHCQRHSIVPAEIVLRIHQPRARHHAGPLREWMISYAQLTAFYQQIDTMLSNRPSELRTGISWCAKCPSLTLCPAAATARYNAIDTISRVFTDTISDGDLAGELDVLNNAYSTIKAHLDALDELAKHRIRSGSVVGNYALENILGNRQWKPGINRRNSNAGQRD